MAHPLARRNRRAAAAKASAVQAKSCVSLRRPFSSRMMAGLAAARAAVTRCDQKRSGWHIVQSGLTSMTCTRLFAARCGWRLGRGIFRPGARWQLGAPSPHGVRHLRPDLKAASAHARADGRADILRRAAEFLLHAQDCLAVNPLRRAAPPHGRPPWPAGPGQRTKPAYSPPRSGRAPRRLVGEDAVADRVVCSRSRPVRHGLCPRAAEGRCPCRVKRPCPECGSFPARFRLVARWCRG